MLACTECISVPADLLQNKDSLLFLSVLQQSHLQCQRALTSTLPCDPFLQKTLKEESYNFWMSGTPECLSASGREMLTRRQEPHPERDRFRGPTTSWGRRARLHQTPAAEAADQSRPGNLLSVYGSNSTSVFFDSLPLKVAQTLN